MEKHRWLGLGLGAILGGLLWGQAPEARGCCILVGKDASADGSVIMAHADWWGGRPYYNFRKVPRMKHEPGATVALTAEESIPQVAETYAYLWAEMKGATYSDVCMNEWGVCLATNYANSARPADDLPGKGIEYMLYRLIAERATTAREAVQLAGQLVERHGRQRNGTMVIADPKEAWVMEFAVGRIWVAKRVPDDQVVMVPFQYVIDEVDVNDHQNVMACRDLVTYAVKKGWYKEEDNKPFSFVQAYNREGGLQDGNQWRVQHLLTGRDIPRDLKTQLPFSVKANRLLSVKGVLEILRDGAKYGPDVEQMKQVAICQLRPGMPGDIGCVYWHAACQPSRTVLTPWYAGVTDTPEAFHDAIPLAQAMTLQEHFTGGREPNPAWKAFRTLQDLVNTDPANRARPVRGAFDAMEEAIFAQQNAVETKALQLFAQDPPVARAYLTGYCGDLGLKALAKANALAAEWPAPAAPPGEANQELLRQMREMRQELRALREGLEEQKRRLDSLERRGANP